jgi:parallel beta-helix repeat protein
MKNKIIKIILVSALMFVANQSKAAGYHYYVDAKSTETQEDGSSQYPFKTINGVLNFINDHDLKSKKIYIRNGEYKESFELTRKTKLYGESKGDVIINADGNQNAVNFVSTSSSLKDMTIKNAEATNIIIDKRSKATITNCKIEKAGKYGIDVKKSSATDKYKFTLKNSEVSDSASQGLYIEKRKISIGDNEIFDNDEEGIDLHNSVKGTISGNNIHGNSESGIEAMLAGVSLNIKNNRIANNKTHGVTIQVYSTAKKGKVKLKNNTIKDNSKYGIRFANYTRKIGPKKFKVFADKHVKLSKNKISGNDSGDSYYQ